MTVKKFDDLVEIQQPWFYFLTVHVYDKNCISKFNRFIVIAKTLTFRKFNDENEGKYINNLTAI